MRRSGLYCVEYSRVQSVIIGKDFGWRGQRGSGVPSSSTMTAFVSMRGTIPFLTTDIRGENIATQASQIGMHSLNAQ